LTGWRHGASFFLRRRKSIEIRRMRLSFGDLSRIARGAGRGLERRAPPSTGGCKKRAFGVVEKQGWMGVKKKRERARSSRKPRKENERDGWLAQVSRVDLGSCISKLPIPLSKTPRQTERHIFPPHRPHAPRGRDTHPHHTSHLHSPSPPPIHFTTAPKLKYQSPPPACVYP
jgi:hypothetical protein